jgi:hypothetical protein
VGEVVEGFLVGCIRGDQRMGNAYGECELELRKIYPDCDGKVIRIVLLSRAMSIGWWICVACLT